MKAIIIDDEKNGAEALQLLLQLHCKNIHIIAVAHSPEDGIVAISNLKPDLVFLDIEMPTGTGFDVVEATQQFNYEIIFTTAYEHYAIKAFKTQAVDYLLKPIDVEELVAAVEKAARKKEALSNKNTSQQLNSLFKTHTVSTKKILIPTGEGVFIVAANEIIHLESDSNYTHVFLQGGRKFLISKTLKSMEEQLQNHHFCRVHSAHLVNLDEIEKYIKGDGGTLILKNKASIPVSRVHKQKLMNLIGLD
jgi:two-component system, LytTR family, response regulator